MSPLALSWVLSTITGYGVYGTEIITHYLRRGGQARDIILTSKPTAAMMPPLLQMKLDPVFALGAKIQQHLHDNPNETLHFKHAVLHACSSDFSGFIGQDRIWGKPNVACAAIEHLICTPHGRAIARNYDMFIAISRWNADYMKSLEVGPVHLCYQGIDPALFYPGPSSGLYRGRFVIFSGGKFEYRKGQDIVLAAFKKFHAEHPDALLVACWQNLSKPDAEAFARAGYCETMPQLANEFGLDIAAWLATQLPADSFVAIPFAAHFLMPSVLRDCDMAVFPNRCEGGTNLVAMEATACGVPTYVAYNTGQKDLVDLIGCQAFRTQRPAAASSTMDSVEGWGETELDEVLAAMEYVYADRARARRDTAAAASRVADWSWEKLNEKLLQTVCDGRNAL